MPKPKVPLRKDYILLLILAVPSILLLLTIDKYYGYYYDNKFFNLLALDIWEHFRVYLYLGSHYHVPSSLYSYLVYPLFLIFGPGDFPMELLAAFFHLLTVYLCYRLGETFHGRSVGLVFALFVGLAPIHLIQVYTLPDLSFAIFLNVAAIYCFLTGLKTHSRIRLTLGAISYSLGCFQAIYSILLFPFFIFYSIIYFLMPSTEPDPGSGKRGLAGKVLTALFFVAAIPAYTYIYLLFKFTFMHSAKSALLMLAVPAVFLFSGSIRRRLPRGEAEFSFLFVFITVALLAYFDLIVQIDYLYFDHSLGYFLDATRAGGYGGRPPVKYMGKELSIYGAPIYMSVLTSIYEFAGSNFAKSSLNLDALRHLYFDYFAVSFPVSVKALFFMGVFTLVIGSAKKMRSEKRFPFFYIYPLVWLAAASAPLVSLGSDYYNIRRIYILPLPYIFSAFGVMGAASAAAFLSARLKLRLKKESVSAIVLVALAMAVSADQVRFSVKNIFLKYTRDKETSMFFKLFYGHYYGRSYKEVGDFLLKDMPPRSGGPVSSVLIYSIPEDTPYGRAMPLFNTVNWYTGNRVKTICDFKDKSLELYGTPERLKRYLEGIFNPAPEIKVIYVADYVDEDNKNFSVFARLYPKLKPYAVVDDDGVKRFDCKLYKFERGNWKAALAEAGYGG